MYTCRGSVKGMSDYETLDRDKLVALVNELADALEDSATSLKAVAVHSVQFDMAKDARKTFERVRSALQKVGRRV